jgi:hypothetical protein
MKSLVLSVLVALVTIVGMSSANAYPMRRQVVRCNSVGYRTQVCYSGIRSVRSVRLLRQYSNSACIGGATYRATYNGVIVSNGCAGDFLVYGY